MSKLGEGQSQFPELESVGALIEGTHVVYASGKHGNAYFNKDAIYPHTALISKMCLSLAKRFVDSDIEAVIAPVLGGMILSQWVAYHLSQLTGRNILALYAEKSETGFVLRRGYDVLVKGRRTLIMEDVLTTGGSVKKVIEVAKAAGAQVIATGALCNRGKVSAQDIGSPQLVSLLNLSLTAWEASECPLCKEGVPVNPSVGKGRK